MHQDEFNFFGEPTWEELPQKEQPVSQDFYEVMEKSPSFQTTGGQQRRFAGFVGVSIRLNWISASGGGKKTAAKSPEAVSA